MPIRQFLISPSIDPLSDKNKELPEETINQVLKNFHISKNKPIITKISRFDFLKDPVGVIEAFKLVRKSIDCQLILAGGTARHSLARMARSTSGRTSLYTCQMRDYLLLFLILDQKEDVIYL